MNARSISAMIASLLLSAGALGQASTVFTYQGDLRQGGAPANGTYALRFSLWTAASGGSQVGSEIVLNSVPVTNGLLKADLNFGAHAFGGSPRWLQIIVNGVTLTPRQALTGAPYAIQTRGIHVDETGRVGLGTAAPANSLDIIGTDATLLLRSLSNNFGPRIKLRNTSGGSNTVTGRIEFEDPNLVAQIGYVKPLIGPPGLQFSNATDVRMKITDSGNIGVGTLDPQANFHIDGTGSTEVGLRVQSPGSSTGNIWFGSPRANCGISGAANNGLRRDIWFMDSGLGLFTRPSTESPFAGNGLFINDSGDVGIGTITPAVRLHVVGTARVNVLEVMGADLAERFPVAAAHAVEPGMVMEIDPDRPGELRPAVGAYSTLVAGVVSGANGLPAGTILGNLPGSEGAPAIALAGRVWVWCDGASGAIRPGDLLTTSDTPGHAMRVADPARALGAVIGKAMSALPEGERGMVLVLVGRQ